MIHFSLRGQYCNKRYHKISTNDVTVNSHSCLVERPACHSHDMMSSCLTISCVAEANSGPIEPDIGGHHGYI